MAERQGLGQSPRIASTPGDVDSLEHWQQRPTPVGLLSSQAYGQACTQYGSLGRESVERTALQRGHPFGLCQKSVFSHPHATETECGTRAGHYVAFRLSHMCGAVKEGTGLGQAATGQDSLGPGDFQRRPLVQGGPPRCAAQQPDRAMRPLAQSRPPSAARPPPHELCARQSWCLAANGWQR